MQIKRLYTISNQDVFSTCEYKTISSVIKTVNGQVICELSDLEMPSFWSQNACDIFAHKYLRKAGVPTKLKKVAKDGVPVWLQKSIPAEDAEFTHETSIKQAIHRLAGCWAYHGWRNKYFDTEDDARAFFDEMQYMLLHQICSPNSPQWFNTGLHWAYGIEGNSGGHYYFDLKHQKIVQSTNAYKYPQVHACFILNVQDHLLGKQGIMDTWLSEAAIFKYGSGAGANFSALRGEGEKLSGGGKSSGLMSFLKIGDVAAGSIKSGGTTRRAAKMVILDCDHPDIEEFIEWKAREEQKVLALVVGSQKAIKHLDYIKNAVQKWQGDDRFSLERNPYLKSAVNMAEKDGVPAGYCNQVIYALKSNLDPSFIDLNYDWNSESYKTVSGQNSNNSIRITDKFLEAVKNDANWDLTARTDGSVIKTVKARKLWEKICYSAWACADPGVQYDDTIQQWHTCKLSGKINATNPCSEYVFLDNTACNLASVNLDKMLDTNPQLSFNVARFEHVCRLLTIMLDISVQMAQYPTQAFAEESHKFRTLGLGYASLGSLLMQYGFAYDSDQGRQLAASITCILTATAYLTSAEMAHQLGTFSEYEKNQASVLGVLSNMNKAAQGHGIKLNAFDNCAGFEFLDLGGGVIKQGDKDKDVSEQSRALERDDFFCALDSGPLTEHAKKLTKQMIEAVSKYGLRNAQTTCIAPTGTISLIMDCGTTSCEPSFSLVSWKKLAGGGDMRVLNPQVDSALSILGYSERQRSDIKHYIFGHANLEKAPYINHQTLASKGFSRQMIDKLDLHLKSSYNLEHAFNMLSEQELLTVGVAANGAKLFSVLGFTDQQIAQANLHCCGHLTAEGAPHLTSVHEEIFTCAVNNGTGVKSIKPMGHIKMLGAIQPFISGASSKTVNMPENSSLQDISDIYLSAWALGVKCVAIYRNNSKFSQALNVTHFKNEKEAVMKARRFGMRLAGSPFYILTQENDKGELIDLEVVMGKEGSAFRTLMDCFAQAIALGLRNGVPLLKYIDAFKNTAFEPAGMVVGYEHIKKALSPLDLLARVLEKEYANKQISGEKINQGMLHMNHTCDSKRAAVQIDGHQFTIHTGETEDGELGEVFFKMSKEGSDFCSLMSSFAKAISIALRYGVDFQELYDQFIDTKFEPYGIVVGHDGIRNASSVIDFAFKCLALWYRQDIVNYEQVYMNNTPTPFDVKNKYEQKEDSRVGGGKSQACTKCFSFDLQTNGSCYVCGNCGETTGCS